MADETKTELQEAVDGFLSTITAASAAVKAATPAAPVQAAPAPLTKERLQETADKRGIGAAMEEFAQEGVLPVVLDTNTKMAKIRKDMATKDATTGPLMKRYGKEIEELAKQRGGALYTAENGYEALAIEVANRDPKFREEQIEAEVATRVAKKLAEQAATPAPTPAAPITPRPSEGVHVGVVSPAAPAPGKTEAERVAATVLAPEEAEFLRKRFGMSAAEAQRNRFEMDQMEAQYGVIGLSGLGGVPVCKLSDIGIPDPDPELDRQLEGRA